MFKTISAVGFLMAVVFASYNVRDNLAYASSALTDGQIVKALVTINDGEIDAANLAKSKATSNDVKEFAASMASDHSANREETKQLSQKLGVKESTSALSVSLLTDAKTNNARVRMSKASDFDKAYVNEQVKMHQAALDTIDQKFLVDVKNTELKNHIEKTRAAVATHLEHAKMLQAKL